MSYLINNFPAVWLRILEHLWLSVTPAVIGLAIAVPLGMLVHRHRKARRVATVLSSVMFTIPSLALFVVIPTIIGTQITNPLNVLIALTLYTVALLTRTVLEALDSVPDDVRAAAEAMGTSRFRQAIGIDLPLSIPVLTAGTRVVAVTNISLVSVGAVIGIGGLGFYFTEGYQRHYPDEIMAGIITILVLAFLFDRLIAILGAVLTPWTRATATVKKRPPRKRDAQTASPSGVTEKEPSNVS